MTTKPTTEAVELLAEIISGPDEDGVIDETWASEVINKLQQNGFTITRAEPSISSEIPGGFKYTEAQQVVWDWWCEYQKEPPVCDDLNNLIWRLDALKDGTICNLAVEKLRLIYSLQTCLNVIKEASNCNTIASATYNSSPILATLADHFSGAKEVAESCLELSLINKDGRLDQAMSEATLGVNTEQKGEL